eukprot:gene4946-6163_t
MNTNGYLDQLLPIKFKRNERLYGWDNRVIGVLCSKPEFTYILKSIFPSQRHYFLQNNSLLVAAKHGNLDLLQFLIENQVECHSFEILLKSAISCIDPHSRDRMVDYLLSLKLFNRERVRNRTWLGECIDEAAKIGSIPLITKLFNWKPKSKQEYSTLAMDWASNNNHFEMVKFLHHLDRNETGIGCTAKAIDNCNNLEIIQFLISNRTEGFTIKAIENNSNQFEIVKYLMESKSLSFTISGYNFSGLFEDCIEISSANGFLEGIKYFDRFFKPRIVGGFQPINKPLYIAIENLQFPVVRYLIENNLVLFPNDGYEAFLKVAKTKGSIDIFEFLLEYTPQPILVHKDHQWFQNVAYNAIYYDNDQVLDLVIRRGLFSDSNNKALGLAIEKGKLEHVNSMLQNYGYSPHSTTLELSLPHLCRESNLGMVRYLHEKSKIYPFINRLFTLNIMNMACRLGHLELVEFLFENRTELCGVNCIDMICDGYYGKVEVVEYLLDTVGTKMKFKCTPDTIKLASRGGYLAIMKLLIDRGLIEPSPTPYNLKPGPFEVAAINGHLDVIQYLDKESIVKFTSSSNAIGFAAAYGHLEVVEYLVKNRTESCNHFAFADSIAHNNVDIVEYLFQHGLIKPSIVDITNVFTSLAKSKNAYLEQLIKDQQVELVLYVHKEIKVNFSKNSFNSACIT